MAQRDTRYGVRSTLESTITCSDGAVSAVRADIMALGAEIAKEGALQGQSGFHFDQPVSSRLDLPERLPQLPSRDFDHPSASGFPPESRQLRHPMCTNRDELLVSHQVVR